MTDRRIIKDENDEVIVNLELADPNLDLDCTSDRWNLPMELCEDIRGRDVINAGTLRNELPRRPANIAAPSVGTVTDVYGEEFQAHTTIRFRDVVKQGWVLHSAGACSYDHTGHASGHSYVIYSALGPFAGYTFQTGDRLCVYATGAGTTYTYAGVYVITEKHDNNTIVLVAPGLGAAATGTKVFFYICRYDDRGRGYLFAGATTEQGADNGGPLLVMSPYEYALRGGWPTELTDSSYLYKNEDQRVSAAMIKRIVSIESIYQSNDTIKFDSDLGGGWVADDKIHASYDKLYDKRGVWITNGRKFWLLHAGVWTQYLDLGDDEYLGQRWDAARISTDLVMFVNPKYPPRVVRVDQAAESGTSDENTIAGCLAPVKPDSIETRGDDDGNTNKSWIMTANASGGFLTESAVYRVLVRAVNLEDNLQSEFVPVYDASDLDDQDITTANTTPDNTASIDVYNRLNYSTQMPPPLSDRWTHIEIWRTQGNGSAYYLERRIEISELSQENSTSALDCLVEQSPGGQKTCTISDTALAGQTLMTTADLNAGRLPPMCRKVASLDGVTICAGKADATRSNPTFYSRICYAASSSYDHTGGAVERMITSGAIYNNYTWQDGDQLVVLSPTSEEGVYDIAAKQSNTQIGLESPGLASGVDVTAAINCYVRRPYTIKWPFIESDELVYYSRTDIAAPESFVTDSLRLSNRGDTLTNMANVLNYVAVIMRNGVHLLYIDSTGELAKHTVSEIGDGSPWERSIATFGSFVVWATPDGPKAMSVNNEADDTGSRGKIFNLDEQGRLRKWFADAYRLGYEVDTGVDVVNQCVRFRRSDSSSHHYETLQFSYRNKKWTILDDDSGLAYASSAYAESTESASPVLYSVTEQGTAFEVNCQNPEATHPYDTAGVTVQATLSSAYTIATAAGKTKITKSSSFSTAMVGDVVRIRHLATGVDTFVRTITAATANYIEFDAISGVTANSTYQFVIGAVRFRLRFAVYNGDLPSTVKTIHGLRVVAYPGEKNRSEYGSWPTLPSGKFTIKVYTDADDAEYWGYTDAELSEIPIFHDSNDVAYTSKDRESVIAAMGYGIQIELECLDAKTGFFLRNVSLNLRDSAHEESDVSATV